jgi:hypothetical protein
VFKLDTSGKETVLYSFTGTGGDGANPLAGLVLARRETCIALHMVAVLTTTAERCSS